MAFSRKKNKWGIEDILSWKPTLEFLGFPFYSRKFQKKRSFTPETPQNCVTRVHRSELLRPKTKTPGNSIWFFLSWPPLKIPCFFQLTPGNWNLNSPPPPPLFFSGIAQGQILRWYTYLAIFVDIGHVVRQTLKILDVTSSISHMSAESMSALCL